MLDQVRGACQLPCFSVDDCDNATDCNEFGGCTWDAANEVCGADCDYNKCTQDACNSNEVCTDTPGCEWDSDKCKKVDGYKCDSSSCGDLVCNAQQVCNEAEKCEWDTENSKCTDSGAISNLIASVAVMMFFMI